jgi:hypothetical protein
VSGPSHSPTRAGRDVERRSLQARGTYSGPLTLSTRFTHCYLPAGETTLGVASVLLVFGALVSDDELLLPLGKPEFGALVAMPLSELVAPGVP